MERWLEPWNFHSVVRTLVFFYLLMFVFFIKLRYRYTHKNVAHTYFSENFQKFRHILNKIRIEMVYTFCAHWCDAILFGGMISQWKCYMRITIDLVHDSLAANQLLYRYSQMLSKFIIFVRCTYHLAKKWKT